MTGISGAELAETASPTANSSMPFYVLGAAEIETNEFDGTTSTHVIWEVMLSLARLSGSSGTDYGMLGVVAA
jgi:hypothetical protein